MQARRGRDHGGHVFEARGPGGHQGLGSAMHQPGGRERRREGEQTGAQELPKDGSGGARDVGLHLRPWEVEDFAHGSLKNAFWSLGKGPKIGRLESPTTETTCARNDKIAKEDSREAF